MGEKKNGAATELKQAQVQPKDYNLKPHADF
jgi:hypothetical protein